MMMLRRSFLLFGFLMSFSVLMAQRTKPTPQRTPPAQKIFKAPKVKTSWGKYTDSSTVSIEEAVELLSVPLTITDDKNTSYNISSYQFLYRKKGVTEDEQTGKVTPVTSIVTKSLRVTPLPEKLMNFIIEQLRRGEEFSFFDVLVKDAQGHIFFAPSLKVKIK